VRVKPFLIDLDGLKKLTGRNLIISSWDVFDWTVND